MSHFLTVVLVPKDTEDVEQGVEKLLAPYSENMEVEPYLYKTREEVVAEKEEITKKVNSVDCPDYLKDYKGKIEQMGLAEFAKDYHEKELDDEENVLTTYNEKARWDWYEIGGRWGDEIKGSICPASELPKDFSAFAIVTPDGEWHEEGKMGWWAIVLNAKDETGWQIEQAALFEVYKDCLAVLVDCHI